MNFFLPGMKSIFPLLFISIVFRDGLITISILLNTLNSVTVLKPLILLLWYKMILFLRVWYKTN